MSRGQRVAPHPGLPTTGPATATLVRPARIQRHRTAGWRLPGNAVSVARPSRWGNPFAHPLSPRLAVEAYREWLTSDASPEAIARGCVVSLVRRPKVSAWALRRQLRDLAGKDLACFCPVDARWCHADVLLDLANGGIR